MYSAFAYLIFGLFAINPNKIENYVHDPDSRYDLFCYFPLCVDFKVYVILIAATCYCNYLFHFELSI
jgi:hypothetical protein